MTTLQQHSNDIIVLSNQQMNDKLMILKSIDVDAEIMKEVHREIREYEQDMQDIKFIMENMSELVHGSKEKLDKIEETIEKVNEDIIESNKDLQYVNDEIVDDKYKYLKITGGALLGGLCLGGVGAIFGIVPAVVGVCVGLGAGSGIAALK